MKFQRIVSSVTPFLTATALLQGCSAVLAFSSVDTNSNRKRVPILAEALDASAFFTVTRSFSSTTKTYKSCETTPLEKSIDPSGGGATTAADTESRKWMNVVRASSLDAYHLIWSPGAMTKMAIGTASLAVADMLFSIPGGRHLARSGLTWMSRSALIAPISSVASNVVLPLLASSCCLLQLWINLLAGGCAGFNTVLGPTRPYFLSLLLYSTAVTHQFHRAKWYRLTALRWGIALLPEAVDVWNRYQERKRANHEKDDLSLLLNAPNTLKATVKLEIPTMGCVACINKIDSALQSAGASRVIEAASFLNPLGSKGGRARVRLVAESREEMDQLVEMLVRSVESAGFEPCRLETLEFDA